MPDRSDKRRSYRALNVNYETDIHYVLQLCQWFLRPIGIWPLIYNRASKCEKLFSAVLITICYSALYFLLIPCVYYILFKEKDINVKLQFVAPVTFITFAIIKYTYVGVKRLEFKRCLSHIQTDWLDLQRQDHRAIMIERVAVGRNLTKLLASLLYFSSVCFNVVMPVSYILTADGNVTVKQLVYPGCELFFDTQRSPIYEIVFFIHMMGGLISCAITVAEASLATTFVIHACGQIRIQILGLKNLVKDFKEGKSESENPLISIVKSHSLTLRFAKEIEEVLREICLLEIMASTFLICFAQYRCIVEWNNNNKPAMFTHISVLISLSFNVLIFCYIGELLVEQCSKIGIASYDIEWYDLPNRRALDLTLLIAISKYPPKLTAGKICDLSLATFGMVLKSSMVYLNLLQTVMEW